MLLCWVLLGLSRRQSRMLKRDPGRYAGPGINVWPGIPAAVSGGTLFAVAGWIVFSIGAKRGDAFGARGILVIALVVGGLACFVWLLVAVFGSSKEAFSRPAPSSVESSGSGGSEPGVTRIANLTPRAGERLVGRYPTNHLQEGRGRGGRLLLTSERLIFTPAGASASNGARAWQVDLQEILRADVASRGSNPFDGSLRRRLQVTDADGHTDYFVVWHPSKLAGIVNDLRIAAGRSSDMPA